MRRLCSCWVARVKLFDARVYRKSAESIKACAFTVVPDLVRRTPVYMSPELINSRNGAKGYDGKQVRYSSLLTLSG